MSVAKSMPAALRNATGIVVRVSEAAGVFFLLEERLAPGWHDLPVELAVTLAEACEKEGVANRKAPLPPGQCIALQALARQIRARLQERKT